MRVMINVMPIALNDLDTVRSWAEHYLAEHPRPDFVVGPPDDHQLERWWIVPRNPVMNLYLHRFVRSDDDRALHDHPWDNASWVLDGEYLEHLLDGQPPRAGRPNDRISRLAEEAHRIEVVRGPVITLFSTGPIRREWGFHCPSGWRPWRDFVHVTEGGNQRGRGCE